MSFFQHISRKSLHALEQGLDELLQAGASAGTRPSREALLQKARECLRETAPVDRFIERHNGRIGLFGLGMFFGAIVTGALAIHAAVRADVALLAAAGQAFAALALPLVVASEITNRVQAAVGLARDILESGTGLQP